MSGAPMGVKPLARRGGLSAITRRVVEAAILVVASLATAVVAALVALAFVLAVGPLPLTVIEPTLRSIVARATPDLRVSFDEPALRWNPEVREIELAVTNLDIRSRDGKELLHVAQAAVSPDVATSLETGRLAVRRLVLDRPEVAITKQADGSLGLRILDQKLVQGGSGHGDPWAGVADFLGVCSWRRPLPTIPWRASRSSARRTPSSC